MRGSLRRVIAKPSALSVWDACGEPIARRLKADGYEHRRLRYEPCNIEAVRRSGRQRPRTDCRGVGDASDIVIVCLPTPAIVQSVVIRPGGVIEGKRARYVVDLSTTGPSVARVMAAALTESGKALIDAPVTGGVAGAKNGVLTP